MKALGEAGGLGRPGLGGGAPGGGRAPLGAPGSGRSSRVALGRGYVPAGLPVLASICIRMP